MSDVRKDKDELSPTFPLSAVNFHSCRLDSAVDHCSRAHAILAFTAVYYATSLPVADFARAGGHNRLGKRCRMPACFLRPQRPCTASHLAE